MKFLPKHKTETPLERYRPTPSLSFSKAPLRGVAVPNNLAGQAGALRSRSLLTPAIHSILLPVQRGGGGGGGEGGCLGPLEPPSG